MSDIRTIELLCEQGLHLHPVVINERDRALEDLIRDNRFHLLSGLPAPYSLKLSLQENRLLLDVHSEPAEASETLRLSVGGLRGAVKDYFLICESYYNAMTTTQPVQLEAIDMGRRGAHDSGAQQLQDMLAKSVTMDCETARRLFTLVCVLHIRNPHKVLVS